MKLNNARLKTLPLNKSVCDGANLYFTRTGTERGKWSFRYQRFGKKREMGLGLGSTRLVSLDDAREQALINRRVARAGGDPIAERNHEMGLSMPFEDATLEVYKTNQPLWENEKHAKQWLATMENHVFPKIGANLSALLNQRTYWRF